MQGFEKLALTLVSRFSHSDVIMRAQGLDGLVEGLNTYINARQLGLQVSEIPDQEAAGKAPAAPAQPVISNDLVTVAPVLLQAPLKQVCAFASCPDLYEAMCAHKSLI